MTWMDHDKRRDMSDVPPSMIVRQRVIEAVCAELGITEAQSDQRALVAERVEAAYRQGRREPLYLVDAGLGFSI